MANTFKFGNGNWAVKDGYALAYNDENNNFKPLPFDFTRASSATRVNKQGLVETVGSGKPRIDFTDNTSGHLLLEPSRTNYSIYSQDTSTWTYVEFGSGSAGTITTGKTDMFGGTNAIQIDFPANAENVSVRFGHTTSSISSGSAQTSLYVKLVGSTTSDKIIQLRTGSDAENTTISGDSFVRYTKTHTKASNEAFNIKLRPSEGTSSGGFSIIVCHPQEEAGSYATSYIPTEGSSVTRVAENTTTQDNVPSTVIGQTEGTVYAEFKIYETPTGTQRIIILSDGTGNERIGIAVGSGILYAFIVDGGSTQCEIVKSSFTGGTYKVAFGYKANDFVLYLNGVQVGTDNSGSVSSCNRIDLGNQFNANQLEGNIIDAKLYNTRLSNTELQNLTS